MIELFNWQFECELDIATRIFRLRNRIQSSHARSIQTRDVSFEINCLIIAINDIGWDCLRFQLISIGIIIIVIIIEIEAKLSGNAVHERPSIKSTSQCHSYPPVVRKRCLSCHRKPHHPLSGKAVTCFTVPIFFCKTVLQCGSLFSLVYVQSSTQWRILAPSKNVVYQRR